jgi:hypothetical protein
MMTQTNMEHVLVVGGTGMLKDVSIHLNMHGSHTSVIGRTDHNLASLKNSLLYKDNFTPLVLDYRDDKRLRTSLKEIQSKYGPIKKVVSWISTTSPNALQIIIEEVGNWNQGSSWSLFHVLGSRSKLEEVKAKVAPPPNCDYRQIKLGFIIEDQSSRWLTNEEISKGIIDGMGKNGLVTIVGTLDPWEKRP